MKLSFECNQDPKSMPNIDGKKFCSLCEKSVFDLRRKSDEKIASFYKANPTACVIAYQDQLGKLVRNNTKTIKTRTLFPYAASLIIASVLPNLIVANNFVFNSNNITQVVQQTKNDSIVTSDNKNEEEKYFVHVRVKLSSKKFKHKAGREIVIYQYKFDSINKIESEDTLACGIIDKKGKAKFNLSKNAFDVILKNEDLIISIDGFSREKIETIKIEGKTIELKISASGHKMRPIMGAF